MSELQTKIEKILSKRRGLSDKILSQFRNIGSLVDEIRSIKRQISNGRIKSCEQFVADLNDIEERLKTAESSFEFLKERIRRTDAVYIGLAGESHAGKSTFIQSLTGLPKDLIPSAEEGSTMPTTAVHSEIYNSPVKEARIMFLSVSEFEQRLVEMLKPLGLENQADIASFENLNLDDVEVKNKNWDKLVKIQRALPYFRNLLNEIRPMVLKEDQFADGKYYFTYMDDDDAHRFFPAVKEAKIYAPFSGVANDVQVVLLDLPGFGEENKVTDATINKLKTVDFTLYIENTSTSQAHLCQPFWDCYNRLKNGIMLKDTFKYYVSFLLNKFETEPGVERSYKELHDELNAKTPNVVLGCALKKDGVLNYADVEENFGNVADTLGETLSLMDEELFGLFKTELNASDLQVKFGEIQEKIQLQTNYNRQSSDDSEDAGKLRKNIDSAYKDLRKEIFDEIGKNQTEFKEIVKEKKNQIKDAIERSLFYPDMDSWEEYARSESKTNGAGGFRFDECERIWVEIVSGYEGLNEYFETKLNDFKTKVLMLFKSNTKNFLSEGEVTAENINDAIASLLQKLEKFGLKENKDKTRKTDIYKAFEFLNNLRQDFRQSIYPYFFKEEVDEYLNPNAAKAEGKLRADKNGLAQFRDKDDSVESTKQQLINFSIAANSKVYETILKYNDFEYYLLSSLNTFDEWLISSRKEITDFIDFVSTFRSDLFPEKYGDESESKKLTGLKMSVEKAVSIVKQIN